MAFRLRKTLNYVDVVGGHMAFRRKNHSALKGSVIEAVLIPSVRLSEFDYVIMFCLLIRGDLV